MTRDEMAAALAAALPDKTRCNDDRGLPISHKLIAHIIADELAEQGWRLARGPLVPLPTSDDTTLTEPADYGSDAR